MLHPRKILSERNSTVKLDTVFFPCYSLFSLYGGDHANQNGSVGNQFEGTSSTNGR